MPTFHIVPDKIYAAAATYDPHHRLGQALFTTSMGLDKRYAED